MRIIASSLVLAALAMPTSAFHVVMMSNYLDSLGGGKPAVRKPAFSPPQPMPEPPQQQQMYQPPPQVPASDEPVMKAMNDLTENFVRNEEATLLALKEISSSMKILAEQGGLVTKRPPPPKVEPKPVPPPPPPQPAAQVPPPPKVEPKPEPVAEVPPPPPPPPGPAPAAPKKFLTPAEQIAYGGMRAPPLPPGPAPAPAPVPPKAEVKTPPLPPPPAPAAVAPPPKMMTPAEKIAYGGKAPPLPPLPAPIPPKAAAKPPPPPPKAAAPAPAPPVESTPPQTERRESPKGVSGAFQRPKTESETGSSVEKVSSSDAPTPTPEEENAAIASGLSLLLAGIGLLYALAGNSEYAMKLPNFDGNFAGMGALTSELGGSMGGSSVSTDTVVVPDKSAPESPSAPEPAALVPEPVPEPVVVPPAPPKPEPVPEPQAVPEPATVAQGLAERFEAMKEKAKERSNEAMKPAAPVPEVKSAPETPPAPVTPPVPATPPAALGGAATGAATAAAGVATGAGAATSAAVAAPVRTGPSTFSYDPSAENGPSAWSTLNIEGNECGGQKQSPIAIGKTGCNIGANYKMETDNKCSVADLEYTLGRGGPKASFPKQCGGNTIEIPVLEGAYQAVQFHTHVGSEHVIGGKRYGAELHIVHKEQKGDRFAVVGIMINGDSAVDNPLFGKLLDKWTAVEKSVAATCNGGASPTKNRPFVSDSAFNVYDLVPMGSSFYHYDGSLTTPPCSEVVWWEVADTPLSVSPEQYDRLVKMTTSYTDPSTCELKTAASPLDGTTNRPIAQDLSGRSVKRICPVGGIAPYNGGSSELLSMVDAVEATTAAVTQTEPALVANSMQADPMTQDPDYDPYRGM